MKRALFLVDLDFISDVPFGDKIIEGVNSLISKFDLVIVSKKSKDSEFHYNLKMSGITTFIKLTDLFF